LYKAKFKEGGGAPRAKYASTEGVFGHLIQVVKGKGEKLWDRGKGVKKLDAETALHLS